MLTRINRKRYGQGHTILEVSMLSILFVVISIFCLDVGFILMASQVNERACRDAARAAAQADNYLSALQLAQAAVAGHQSDGYFVSTPTVEAGQFVYQDFGGNAPPNVSPFVSVTTSTNVRIPAPVFFFGESVLDNGSMRFTKTYTFPIVKMQLYL
ncbi:MAG: hypothetical protein K2W82_03130 [Candidatus Obscuribacterales bacterium]|nr:hypothetical protein [Candidatus Obscuribacterales bacterium]